MNPGKTVLGTLGYVVVTFPLAYVWHLVAFKSTYEELGYISRKEPIVAFGFVAIVTQGVLLSAIYQKLCAGKSLLQGALTLAAVMGIYHWTTHVLAEAAKHPIEPLSAWFALESTYLAIQFLLGGFVIALANRDTETAKVVAEARDER